MIKRIIKKTIPALLIVAVTILLSLWGYRSVVQDEIAAGHFVRLKDNFVTVAVVEAILILAYLGWSVISAVRLAHEKDEVQKQLQISNTLLKCVTELNTYSDIDVAIRELLQIIGEYFDGDRAYLFDIDHNREEVNNTYEYVKEGVSKEIDNLQNVPLHAIDGWIEMFEKEGAFFISDTDGDLDKESLTYELLVAQNIHSLVAVPLLKNGEIDGFLGVDNPRKHYQDPTLLSSIEFFVADSLRRKDEQKAMEIFSFRDELTGLNNRNKFKQMSEKYKTQDCDGFGIAFMDLNGLKKANDEFGHEAGDVLLKKAAYSLEIVFQENAYRIGGDEFVVLLPDVTEEMLQEKIEDLRTYLKNNSVSMAMGMMWKPDTKEFDAQLEAADKLMYEDKALHYNRRKNG